MSGFGRFSISIGLTAGFLFVSFGGAGGCGGGSGGGGGGENTRNMKGTVDSNSLDALTIRSVSQSGLSIKQKNQALACEDLQICCFGYDGEATVVDVESDCTWTIALPLDSFCYCGAFTGGDADGDGCGDEYIASAGCRQDGYSGAIPIFRAADGGTDDIDLGTVGVQGDTAVPENDPCAQVDSDDDGTDDAGDSDDDGDGVADESDFACAAGCMNADEFDSDDDDIPDIFENAWDGLDDGDGDNIPDFCDDDECDCDAEDTDCDCLPDEFDESEEDDDGDGVDAFLDCDDDDPEVALGCYEEDLCGLDLDGDGVDFCDDCDDLDEDDDRTFEDGCEEEGCEIASCDGNFECQLEAEEAITEGDPICEGNGVSCMTCIDGCCVLSE